MASDPFPDHEQRPGVRPKRTHIVGLCTDPPENATVVCADGLGPVIPRTLPPAPGWSGDGHRIKALLDYSRGPEKTRGHGAVRVHDGQPITLTASSRDSLYYQQFLEMLEQTNPVGDIHVITDNLSSHNSKSTREWLLDHPRIKHAFIPVGACWLNLQEPWWRLFRREALTGQSFADPKEIDQATRQATAALNARAKPWIRGRPAHKPGKLRRRFIYRL